MTKRLCDMTSGEREDHFDRKVWARVDREDARAIARLDRQMADAEPLLGSLMRDGKEVVYINTRSKSGKITGKTREFPYRFEAISFLIRNHYV